MKVALDKVVTIHYTLTDKDGEILDSSKGQDPLTYLHGKGNIIPGLEKALLDKVPGDKVNVTVAPEEAYGKRDSSLHRVVAQNAFKDVEKLDVGMQFQAQMEDGPQVFTITEISGDQITIDGNHPLADQELTFDVEITDIRDATEEELEHGHVHGPEGHAH